MKVRTTVKLNELVADAVRQECPHCKGEVEVSLKGLTVLVERDVLIAIPDQVAVRDDQGRIEGVTKTADLLEAGRGTTSS